MQDGRADGSHDRRYRALVLLATFASLRWGEITALRRCDLDLIACTVRVRAALTEQSTGELVLGPLKSRAGRRVVGFPRLLLPVLEDHLTRFVGPEATALLFPGVRGGPMRRSNFNNSRAGRTLFVSSELRVFTSTTCAIPGTTWRPSAVQRCAT
jgi:integrase